MNLVWAQQDDFFALVIQHAVLANHQVRGRDVESSLGKCKVILNGLVVFIYPACEELLIELSAVVGGDVARLGAVCYHEHLHEPHQATELAFFAVFLDLTICVHERVILVFQLNVNQRQTIDEKRDVKTAISGTAGFFDVGAILVDDFVTRFAACHFTIVDGDKRNGSLGSVLSYNRNLSDAVFTG